MTREEAISCIKQIKFRGYLRGANPFYEQDTEALEMAIQALSQEPCDDAVSRRKAISVISACDGKSAQIEALEQLTPVTQKSGYWIRKYDRIVNELYWECNKCGEGFQLTSNFCPNCGARMESEDKE